jgi:type IV pilus assembly protein PilY1
MKRLVQRLFAAMFLVLLALPAAQAQHTSDIDIYGNANSATDAPNVLLVLDNTANWNTMFSREIAAMVNAFNGLPENKFRVGLMMFSETGGGNSTTDGGYVRAAIRPLDAGYKTKLGDLLNSLHILNDKSNGGKAGLAMLEAYRYFSGGAPRAGNDKNKADFSGNTSGSTQSNAVYALTGNALASRNASTYNSPVISNCARNYIIYISNGAAQDNNADTTAGSTALSAAYAALGRTRPADITGLSPSGSQSNLADEWARFMKDSPQAVTTFTLDVDPITTGQGPGWSALMSSMASRSGGQYYKINSTVNNGAQILDALVDIFNQIQSVNSVFASASLPVSVNARGTYLNQVFIGMFRPDGDADPRWAGNLKQYKFGYDPTSDTLSLIDALGNSAISGATGFISPSAVSLWTQTSTFWINQPMGTPPSSSDRPDGEVVEKGGVAQGIRSTYASNRAARKVYTCVGCAADTNLTLSVGTSVTTTNSTLTTAMFNVASSTDLATLLGWIRGDDNAANESGPGGTVTVRPSIHGDVLHSRPAVVNYGTTTGVVAFYGANDGMLRAVNGNQTGAGAGQELWSFLPKEHFGKFVRQRANSPSIRLSTTVLSSSTSTVTPIARDYFVDGTLEVYQKIASDGSTERAIVYATMRRGGRFLYALDVTDPTQPKYLWSRSSADLPILGQTFSSPKVARVRGHTNPVIIMGAGYDNVAEDVSPPASTTTMGTAVLVLDAFNGTEVKRFSTLRSVAADVSLLDSDNDGYIDRAYAVDVGGNVYRINFETPSSTATTNWSHYRFAALNGTGTRKFFYAPDLLATSQFTAILAGTGDREKPLATTSSDQFFTLFDTHVAKGTPTTAHTAIVPADLGRIGTDEDKAKGCYLPVRTTGEKIINAPLTAAGVTYFSTNQPTPSSPGTCSANLGVARVYSVPLFCKTATQEELVGGGLPPSFVTGIVEVSYTDPGSNQPRSKKVPFIIGAPNPKKSAIEGIKINPLVPPTRRRTYWYREGAR